jgi:hypothetical protein
MAAFASAHANLCACPPSRPSSSLLILLSIPASLVARWLRFNLYLANAVANLILPMLQCSEGNLSGCTCNKDTQCAWYAFS